MPYSLLELVGRWKCESFEGRGKKIWLGIMHGTYWGIWKERNRRIFEGVKKSHLEVVESNLFEVASWFSVSNDFPAASINDFTRDWYSCIVSYTLTCNT